MIKKAFTLIELILVIVILAILSLIGSNIYTNVYKNYLTSKVVDEVEDKTKLALDQIASRLSDRVKQATIGRKSSNPNDIVLVYDSRLQQDHDILEWIGQSTQSRNLAGNSVDDSIGWSGFLDMGRYEDGKAILIGGRLSAAINVINSISRGGNQNLAMIFQGISTTRENGYGFRGENPNKIMVFNMPNNGARITLARDYMGEEISDRYQIAHSAYAIVPENGNLYLYYDYRPWIGQTYRNGRKSLLVENITLFRFRGFSASGMDLKLCVNANAQKHGVTDNNRFVVCKTKVVF
ncbi:type II secretion system protein [Campylobacter ureolyticus]|uniref:Prepilin-type N-terminal cleavage/methylation domain-containing protein n=1 Tax=Campylobacter ureolyticus TaxID=827 RepID=A0A9Q4KJF4_9BACT|nr:prepilin-type N-terminal cleavage/methylation domain-containing protein [Campylobacter ureolyticus]MCZ6159060.1 prepilin-type N-terminal cleavage/methylation domain-containing protein [Campylobacter ureolyticus]MCZ6162857.1 prepilin-type N-terminal cleavage/methylation domain-containing protein [Campylobacter ureolyticus]MCZ6164650.1 prepilin-type N-terminal cleavage/methylation domain-containing protein [Campylobacter ureolyticus]MCZ6166450.1 prepilin-type N-terminal cleavage/methylation do